MRRRRCGCCAGDASADCCPPATRRLPRRSGTCCTELPPLPADELAEALREEAALRGDLSDDEVVQVRKTV